LIAKTSNLIHRFNEQVTVYREQTILKRLSNPLKNFGSFNLITGTAKPKVVKFCIQVVNSNFNKTITYHLQKGCNYRHVTVSKILSFGVM